MSHVDTSHTGPDWAAAIKAGLLAGLVFIVLEMILVPIVGGGSALGPPTMISAIVLGPEVLPPPGTPPGFAVVPFVTGQLVHFALSIVLALIFALIMARLKIGTAAAVGIGAAFGLVVYVVNFYGLTAMFPWFVNARTPVTIFAHLVFGAVLAWSYLRFAATRTV